MATKTSPRIQDHFAQLTDSRTRKVRHPMINIVAIAVCANLHGSCKGVGSLYLGPE